MKIYNDKGHGEHGDPGACKDGLIERDMTIITGNALGKRLEEYGWDVVLLANAVAQGLKKAGQTKVNIVKCKANSRGTEYFGILRTTKMPAVIVETCFIDNAADRVIADTVEELHCRCSGDGLWG